MRKTETVTINAETLEEARLRLKAQAEHLGLGETETELLLSTAKAGEPGRDEGKQFLLTEMPVYKAEKWAARALLVVSRGLGKEADADTAQGFAGLSKMNWAELASVRWEDAEPLMDEMMACVKVKLPSGGARQLYPDSDDIEEVSTLFKLRKAILKLHFGFFKDAGA